MWQQMVLGSTLCTTMCTFELHILDSFETTFSNIMVHMEMIFYVFIQMLLHNVADDVSI